MKKCYYRDDGKMRYWSYNGACYFVQAYDEKDCNQSVYSKKEFEQLFTLQPYIKIELF
jgi:hypothetical protein